MPNVNRASLHGNKSPSTRFFASKAQSVRQSNPVVGGPRIPFDDHLQPDSRQTKMSSHAFEPVVEGSTLKNGSMTRDTPASTAFDSGRMSKGDGH